MLEEVEDPGHWHGERTAFAEAAADCAEVERPPARALRKLARAVLAAGDLAGAAAAHGTGFVDTAALAAEISHRAWADDRCWYLSQTPFFPATLVALAGEVAMVIAARAGLARKCLALNLDNTLWGAVIGTEDLVLHDDLTAEGVEA